MLCNVSPESRTLPVIIDSDVAFAVMVAALGLSAGYIGNICLTEAPKTSGLSELTQLREKLIKYIHILCFLQDDPTSQEATSLALTAFFVTAQASGSTLGYIAVISI